ncbi:bifunctional tRNA (5-methylaminomethyl-2-thiouridine)(34)-methyltransferase MnmD/FAD-dependent 5-carboxymethylaminomethyl-2-thiouridine(34) oxidoreductase MnmC [Thalassotalea euphylliae]|uniref:bifunctional tRNA (5-methylaminomethyl-2-thiouridine)(34)-methyltransferase MnmD/FAD-dependent 5-carboxymethylaminomethyl-2-thiouridine(34) oxidoreductase MnmC n=1 Tax=Thalassotalea euphylliae TaxID=1655234 RepID=UPI00362995FF
MTNKTQISFQANGAPYSLQFDDIYFDTESGCQQSEQVFINGNNINSRLLSSECPVIIGETGFGTGLNFFLTAHKLSQAIEENGAENIADVTFYSVEKFPLSKAQIKTSLQMWHDLQPLIDDALTQYPDVPEGKTTLSCLDGKIKLVLIFDDATEGFKQLNLKHKQKINAWYLDGFSPANNQDMWSEALFEQIARLSSDDASLATFTVAGFVRRHLTNVGFRVAKRNTVGKKKQTLVAKFQQPKNKGKSYLNRPQKPKVQHVTIIGGGIAAACLSYQLTKQGVKVTLLCKDETIAEGASSNAIGALYPLIHLVQDEISQFYVDALHRSRAFYDTLLSDGYQFAHDWCGLLEVSYKESLQVRQKKFEQSPCWPKDVIHSVNADKASKLSGASLHSGGMFIPKAGWIAPKQLVSALVQAASDQGIFKVKTNTQVTELTQLDSGNWLLTTSKGKINASTVVVCAGADSDLLTPIDELPQYPVRGQVSEVADTGDAVTTVICHKGYLTPANNGNFCIGATFDKQDRDINTRDVDNDYNREVLAETLPEIASIPKERIVNSKARLRAMTPDHLPIAGPMPKTELYPAIFGKLAQDKNWKINEPAPYYDNLYVMSGLGARGLCSAPLVSDILVADLCNLPYPVDSKMRFNLAPNRFILKDIIKGKHKTQSQ